MWQISETPLFLNPTMPPFRCHVSCNPCAQALFALLLHCLQVIQCYVPYFSGIQLFCTEQAPAQVSSRSNL